MIAEQITNVKNFMAKLLLDSAFDEFLVNEISITTYNTFEIDGHIQKDFFSEEELSTLPDSHLSKWATLRPFCYSIIKGNKTPIRFRMIFAMPRDRISALLTEHQLTFSIEDVNELFLNIKYENGALSCVTGTSLKIFTMDKSLEKAFDSYISNFISTLF